MSALQRRALINGAVAALVTFVVGTAVVETTSGDGIEPAPQVPPSNGSTPVPPACTPTWEVVPSASPGESGATLQAVTALSAGEAWAVGFLGDPASPTDVLIERWDGIGWTQTEAPSPGSERNELRAVDASEPNDVWAVGRTSSGFGDRPLVLRFDGTAWVEVALPDEVDGVLNGVAALSPTDVWAVGSTGEQVASLERALVMHWDGLTWTVVDVGRAVGGGKSLLHDVDAASPTDVWAVGYHRNRPQAIRFDGEAWAESPTDVDGVLLAVEVIAGSDVWGVGAPIQRFDGRTWSAFADVRGDGELRSVAAVSATDVWAVGIRPAGEEATRTLVVRWDGERWAPVDGPGIPGSDALAGIDALPDGTVLAVGAKDVAGGRRTLAVRGSTCLPAG